MLPDQVSNPGPLTYESGALPIALRGPANQKVIKRELSFLYATHRHDLFYITVKYHRNIPKGIQVIERTRKCLRTDVRTDRLRTGARLV